MQGELKPQSNGPAKKEVRSWKAGSFLAERELAVLTHHSPFIIPVVTEADDSARIQMKCSVLVERSPGDVADNREDGKVVTHDNERLFRTMAAHDPAEAVPRPLPDVEQPLTAGNIGVRGRLSPPAKKIGTGRLNFRKRQAFDLAVIELAQTLLDGDGEVMEAADRGGRLMRPFEMTGVNRVDFLAAQVDRRSLRLLQPNFVELQVGRALASLRQIPVGGPMPQQKNPHVRVSAGNPAYLRFEI